MKLSVFDPEFRSRYAGRVRVYLDGEDVTDRCQEADDESGVIRLLRHRDGHAFVVAGWCLAHEVTHGHVRIEVQE